MTLKKWISLSLYFISLSLSLSLSPMYLPSTLTCTSKTSLIGLHPHHSFIITHTTHPSLYKFPLFTSTSHPPHFSFSKHQLSSFSSLSPTSKSFHFFFLSLSKSGSESDEAADSQALTRRRLLPVHAPPLRLPAAAARRLSPPARGGSRGARAGVRGRGDGAVRGERGAPEPPGFREAPEPVRAGIRVRAEGCAPNTLPRHRFSASPGSASTRSQLAPRHPRPSHLFPRIFLDSYPFFFPMLSSCKYTMSFYIN